MTRESPYIKNAVRDLRRHLPGQPADDGLREVASPRLVERRPARLRFLEGRRVVAPLRAGALEPADVERREIQRVEREGLGPVGPGELEVRARPVDDGHEVVGDDVDAAGAQTPQRLLVVGDAVAPHRLRAELHGLVHGHGLDDAPREPRGLDEGLALLDERRGPDLARGDLQGRDDARAAGHFQRRQRHGVVRAHPAHGLLHDPIRRALLRPRRAHVAHEAVHGCRSSILAASSCGCLWQRFVAEFGDG